MKIYKKSKKRTLENKEKLLVFVDKDILLNVKLKALAEGRSVLSLLSSTIENTFKDVSHEEEFRRIIKRFREEYMKSNDKLKDGEKFKEKLKKFLEFKGFPEYYILKIIKNI